MSLHEHKSPLITQGWLRAMLLLAIVIIVSAIVGSFILTMNGWLIFSSFTSITLVLLAWKYIDRRHFSSIGFRRSYFFPDSVTGFLLGLLLVSAGSLLIYLFNGMQWVEVSLHNDGFFVSMLLLLIVAVAEEMVFRGYILRNLMKSFNKWVALVISALLFAMVHLSNPDIPFVGMLNIILGGLLLGITFMFNRSLWLPVFFHFSWNLFQGPVFGFPVSGLAFGSMLTIEPAGPDLLTGGSFGFEGSVICTVILLAAFLIILLWYLRRS